MRYFEFTFNITPSIPAYSDVLEALLAQVEFDSFVKDDTGQEPLKAYVRTELFNEKALQQLIHDFPLDASIKYSYKEAENKNWNAEWEAHNFKPLIIDQRCAVSTPNYPNLPHTDYHILLNPRMSFGTGHHETTRLMLEYLLDEKEENMCVLDMGCGTGILALMARMRGAQEVVAIDYDEWCTQNTEENIRLNRLDHITTITGDAKALSTLGAFDLILANIHINIITADLPTYTKHLKEGGKIRVSGFYESDLPKLQKAAQQLGLKVISHRTLNNWCCATIG